MRQSSIDLTPIDGNSGGDCRSRPRGRL